MVTLLVKGLFLILIKSVSKVSILSVLGIISLLAKATLCLVKVT